MLLLLSNKEDECSFCFKHMQPVLDTPLPPFPEPGAVTASSQAHSSPGVRPAVAQAEATARRPGAERGQGSRSQGPNWAEMGRRAAEGVVHRRGTARDGSCMCCESPRAGGLYARRGRGACHLKGRDLETTEGIWAGLGVVGKGPGKGAGAE